MPRSVRCWPAACFRGRVDTRLWQGASHVQGIENGRIPGEGPREGESVAFYVGFNVGGYELGLVPVKEQHATREPAGIAYWAVEDAASAYQGLIDLGATMQEPGQDVGGGILIGSVRDPFGNILGVIQNPNFKATGN